MCGSVDLLVIYIYRYIYIIYITKKGVTRILSVFRWDVSNGEVLGILQSQVLPCKGCFITVTIKF
jgi:hypothetical protein